MSVRDRRVKKTTAVIIHGEVDTETIVESKAPIKKTPRLKTASLSDFAANDYFFYIGHKVDQLKSVFPNDFEMYHVDKFYPNADGGPLFIDEERYNYESRKLELKEKEMKKAGLRYLIIKKGMTEQDILEVVL